MDDMTGGMLGILPPLMVGGAALMFTERFLGGQNRQERKPKPFDRQEYKDNRRNTKGMEFGNFSNLGF